MMRAAQSLICLTLMLPILSLTAAGADAQTGGPSPMPGEAASTTTIPEQVYPCNPGSYEPPAGIDEQRAAELAGCEDEVIEPPSIGDEDATIDPPDAGTTRVIPPDQVPQQ